MGKRCSKRRDITGWGDQVEGAGRRDPAIPELPSGRDRERETLLKNCIGDRQVSHSAGSLPWEKVRKTTVPAVHTQTGRRESRSGMPGK